jgi:hypothetical protein
MQRKFDDFVVQLIELLRAHQFCTILSQRARSPA